MKRKPFGKKQFPPGIFGLMEEAYNLGFREAIQQALEQKQTFRGKQAVFVDDLLSLLNESTEKIK